MVCGHEHHLQQAPSANEHASFTDQLSGLMRAKCVMSRREPLDRRVNTRTRGVSHGGGEFRWSRHASKEDRSGTSAEMAVPEAALPIQARRDSLAIKQTEPSRIGAL
jgi:hypothetical protein